MTDEMQIHYVVTLCLCKGSPAAKTYVVGVCDLLDVMHNHAQNMAKVHGHENVRLRKLVTKSDEERESLFDRAYFDNEKLEDFHSDHGVDESGGYF